MSERTSDRFVLLVAWADGTSQVIPIPPTRVVGLGPESEPPTRTRTLYAPNTRREIGWVVVHGEECPKVTVAPAPAAGIGTPTAFRANQSAPEWLAELMAELVRRHGSSTIRGLKAAAAGAVRVAADFELRSRSCASLACGYHAAAAALAAIDEQDAKAWARYSETARDFFEESVKLAREAEEMGA